MKLTKIQRYTVYCIMLEEAENPSTFIHPTYTDDKYRSSVKYGLCWMYALIFGNSDMYNYYKTMLPELYNQSTCFPYFSFYSWDERREALKKCIELTHP